MEVGNPWLAWLRSLPNDKTLASGTEQTLFVIVMCTSFQYDFFSLEKYLFFQFWYSVYSEFPIMLEGCHASKMQFHLWPNTDFLSLNLHKRKGSISAA